MTVLLKQGATLQKLVEEKSCPIWPNLLCAYGRALTDLVFANRLFSQILVSALCSEDLHVYRTHAASDEMWRWMLDLNVSDNLLWRNNSFYLYKLSFFLLTINFSIMSLFIPCNRLTPLTWRNLPITWYPEDPLLEDMKKIPSSIVSVLFNYL